MNPPLEVPRTCVKCGRPIPPGQADCTCLTRPRYWLHSRETILLLCFVGLGAAFGVTGFAARIYHSQRGALAREWHARGAADLSAGRAEAALADFRTAMIYARANVTEEEQRAFQLDLAEALVATGRSDEARSYLLDLWEQAPGDGKINLELARQAVRSGDDEAARRYYQAAIDGVWEGDSAQVVRSRFETRMELYGYLLSRGQATAAQSVLLATAASLPPDATLYTQVGQRMLDGGMGQPALAQFEQALRIDPRNAGALTGAGLASFQLGDDRATVRYLERASREKSRQPPVDAQRVEQVLAIAQSTLAIDPFRAGLEVQERARRVVRSLDTATARLESCAAARGVALPKISAKTPAPAAEATDLASLYVKLMKMKSPAQESGLVRDSQRIESSMNLVFSAEAAVTEQCGPTRDPVDAALVRIASADRKTTARD